MRSRKPLSHEVNGLLQGASARHQRLYMYPLGPATEAELEAQWAACRQAAGAPPAAVDLPIQFGRRMHIAADQVTAHHVFTLGLTIGSLDSGHC